MPLCLPPLCIYPSPFPLPAVRESGRCCRRCRCCCRCCGRQCPPPLHAHQDALLPRLRCRPSHTVRDAATPCKADKSYMIGTGEEGAGSLRRGTAVDGTTTDQYFPDARTNGRTSCHRSQIYAGERQVPCRSKDIFRNARRSYETGWRFNSAATVARGRISRIRLYRPRCWSTLPVPGVRG